MMDFLPMRPRRKEFSLQKIAEYWGVQGKRPFCFRCDRIFISVREWKKAQGYLERAHVIDRVFNGLDSLSNIVPLCSSCHSSQPSFKAGDEWLALLWTGAKFIGHGDELQKLFSISTDLNPYLALGKSTPFKVWCNFNDEKPHGTPCTPRK